MALVTRSIKLPKFIFYTFYLLNLINTFINWLFTILGISSLFMDSPPSEISPPHDRIKQAELADLIRTKLPVVKFKDLVSIDDRVCTQKNCAVCLCDFEGEEEIRPLTDCCHIFHRSCLDGWIDHDHRTCPLCRTPFILTQKLEAVKEETVA